MSAPPVHAGKDVASPGITPVVFEWNGREVIVTGASDGKRLSARFEIAAEERITVHRWQQTDAIASPGHEVCRQRVPVRSPVGGCRYHNSVGLRLALGTAGRFD